MMRSIGTKGGGPPSVPVISLPLPFPCCAMQSRLRLLFHLQDPGGAGDTELPPSITVKGESTKRTCSGDKKEDEAKTEQAYGGDRPEEKKKKKRSAVQASTDAKTKREKNGEVENAVVNMNN